jgi:V/A-type H+-transporting ATPase subunit I
MCLKASLFPDRMFKLRLVLPKNVVDKTVETITELGSYEPADVKSAFGENIEWARHDLLVVTDHITKLEGFFEYFELSIIPEPDKTYKFKNWREAAQEAIKEAKEIEAEFEERMNKIREIETKMFEVSALLSKPHTLPEEMAKKLKEVAGLIALSEIPKDLQSDLTVLDAAAKELIKLTEEFVRQLALKILKELEEEKKIIFEDARAWAFENEEKIKHVYGLLKTVENALKVLAKGRETEHFVYLEGYVPESKLKRTLKKLEEIIKDKGFLVAHLVDMDKETPPTYVKVESEAVKTALNVENIYGAPNPRELVPALIMAFTLPFIYMFMSPIGVTRSC